ncbi:hypothetical protein [Streptomyces sp. NPDC059991]|uniref:hypothetical protein n=1 Tax=unclassified Streptomyces TaxID=2593676 RepID=UPI00369E915F
MTHPAPAIPVHILDEHTVHIHTEPLALPPGIDPDHAVLSYLHLEAAGAGHSINARIHDRRYGITAHLTVHPDGATTTHPLAPDAQPLATIHALARQGRLDTAIEHAESLLLQMSASPRLGPQHPQTLNAAETRAHLAWIEGDFAYAYRAWSWIAAAWHDHGGPCPRHPAHDHAACRHLAQATSNAAAAWTRLPADQAAAAGHEILALLARNAADPHTPAAHAIAARLSQIAAHSP